MEHWNSLFTIETSPQKQVAKLLLNELSARHMTITVAEGTSGGKFLDDLTIPGSTSAFHMGCVAYSLRAKLSLGVPKNITNTYGEYSPEVAIALCQSMLLLRNDSLSVAVVGNIEPTIKQLYPTAYLAMKKTGDEPWVTPIYLKSQSRHERKSELSLIMLSRALLYVRNQHHLENSHLNLPSITHTTIEKEEINPHLLILTEYLKMAGLTISTMESCTGGALANTFTNVRGASEFFDSAWIAYDENAKIQYGVPLDSFAFGNVYSEQVALAMAQAVMKKTGTDIAISTTGTMDNPDTRPFHTDTVPGTVYIAILVKDKAPFVVKLNILSTQRDIMKNQIVKIILETLSIKLGISSYSTEKLLTHTSLA